MFSKEMEALIQATLEDGILEENEKAALIKRAQKEGIDLDELDIYINSILQKRKKEQKEKDDAFEAQLEKEKKKAMGPVCPRCHKQVPPLTLVCDCGYEFTNKKSASSVRQLYDKIENIMSTPLSSDSDKHERNKMIRNVIVMFPVPNTKEDIVEFLSLSASRSKKRGGLFGSISGRLLVAIPICILLSPIFFFVGMFLTFSLEGAIVVPLIVAGVVIYICITKNTDILDENKTARVWRGKFSQVMMKGRSLLGDLEFQKQLDYFDNLVKK